MKDATWNELSELICKAQILKNKKYHHHTTGCRSYLIFCTGGVALYAPIGAELLQLLQSLIMEQVLQGVEGRAGVWLQQRRRGNEGALA